MPGPCLQSRNLHLSTTSGAQLQPKGSPEQRAVCTQPTSKHAQAVKADFSFPLRVGHLNDFEKELWVQEESQKRCSAHMSAEENAVQEHTRNAPQQEMPSPGPSECRSHLR
jgi:hypothetical protein